MNSASAKTVASPAPWSDAIAAVLRQCPPFRGKARVQRWMLPNAGVRSAVVFGCRMELDLSDEIQRDMYAGLYEAREPRSIRALLRPGMTAVDVGANVGYYTWLTSGLVGPRGRVVAFEPGPYAFERLQRVVRENRISNVECHNVAVSDRAGHATLYVPPREEGNYNPSLEAYMDGMTQVEVPTVRLDDLFPSQTIDFMKLDVEGHELHVLAGAARLVREGRLRAILSEFNQYVGDGPQGCSRLENWFAGNGFVLKENFPLKWGPKAQNRLYVRP